MASNPMQLVPDSAREIRRVRRRSDKSFMCQFQHLAWPPSAFSQAGRARAGGAYGNAAEDFLPLTGLLENL